MATNPTPNYEIPAEMRDFAEKSVEQARKAIDGFMGAAQKTVDTFEGSANTVQASAKDAEAAAPKTTMPTSSQTPRSTAGPVASRVQTMGSTKRWRG